MARSALALLLLVLSSLACAPRPSPTGVAVDPRIVEPSGLVASAAHPGVYWTHGDSGNGNWLFAIDERGQLLGRYRVSGAENVDWEDITRDDAGNLWLGDIGNNDGQRRDLAVLRLVEPTPAASPEDPGAEEVGTVRVAARLDFHYPDQQEFGGRHHDFDAESLLWWQGSLWLLTKHRGDQRTKLYRFPRLEGDEVELELVDEFDLGPSLGAKASRYPGMTTAADLAPDGRHWALLSYDAVFVFAVPDAQAQAAGASLLDAPVNRIELDPSYVRQVEALSWDEGGLLLCNEEGALFRLAAPLEQPRYPE